jgi:hypothetical protein
MAAEVRPVSRGAGREGSGAPNCVLRRSVLSPAQPRSRSRDEVARLFCEDLRIRHAQATFMQTQGHERRRLLVGGHPSHVRCPMERFFSRQNIERYRKLLDISTDEPERRRIFNVLKTQAHTIQMDNTLHVRVERRGDRYTWELHRHGRFHPVKFSAPVYVSEEAARAYGNEARAAHLAYLVRLAARRPKAK